MTDTTKHICRVGTARIDYQGRVGQRVLNATVKSGTGLGAGFAPTWDTMVVRGSIEDRSFCAFLLDGAGVVRSSVSLDRKRDVRRSFELIRRQIAPDPTSLADPDVDLRTLV